jgi:hypothetical protein
MIPEKRTLIAGSASHFTFLYGILRPSFHGNIFVLTRFLFRENDGTP